MTLRKDAARSTISSSVRPLQLSLALLAGALIWISCAPKSDTDAADREVPATDFSSCEYKPNIGQQALNEYANQSQTVRSDFFNKLLPDQILRGVARASIEATSKYVARTVRIYRVKPGAPAEAKLKCPALSGLAAAPEAEQMVWDHYNKSVKKGSMLAGLYFEACTAETPCRAGAIVAPTILLNPYGSRWTMLHEFTHHLFNLGRVNDPDIPITDWKLTLRDRVTQRYSELNKTVSEATLKTYPAPKSVVEIAINQVTLLTQDLEKLMVITYFEEMAVEGYLLNLVLKKELEFVSTRDAANARWYSQNNFTAASRLLADLNSELYTLSSLLSVEDRSALKEKFDKAQGELARIRDRGAEVLARNTATAEAILNTAAKSPTNQLDFNFSAQNSLNDSASDPTATDWAQISDLMAPIELATQKLKKHIQTNAE